MKCFPTLRQITAEDKLNAYSEMYFNASGLPIPQEYMSNEKNRVFAINCHGKMIGGFILARDIDFRTIKFFARPERQSDVIAQLEELTKYTEITCFWIKREYRTNTFLNMFTWLSMTYALRVYGTKYFLFGTCSRSLARLYSQTSKSIQIHRDRVNKKTTFIFKAHRSSCITGMFEIIAHKLRRTFKTIERPSIYARFSNLMRSAI